MGSMDASSSWGDVVRMLCALFGLNSPLSAGFRVAQAGLDLAMCPKMGEFLLPSFKHAQLHLVFVSCRGWNTGLN